VVAFLRATTRGSILTPLTPFTVRIDARKGEAFVRPRNGPDSLWRLNRCCVSFIVMKELRLTDALATDNHFRIAGFNPLLAD